MKLLPTKLFLSKLIEDGFMQKVSSSKNFKDWDFTKFDETFNKEDGELWLPLFVL